MSPAERIAAVIRELADLHADLPEQTDQIAHDLGITVNLFDEYVDARANTRDLTERVVAPDQLLGSCWHGTVEQAIRLYQDCADRLLAQAVDQVLAVYGRTTVHA